MVSLDFLPGSRAWSRSAEMRRCRFNLGGLALELLPEPGFCFDFPPETNALLQAHCAAPTLAAATCSVRVDPSLDDASCGVPRGCVAWEQTPDGIRLLANQVLLEVAALGPAQYVVAARIGTASVLTRMLNMLVTALAELAGGLALHATAVVLRGQAVLLLGPSGAGKTTAAGLLGEDVTCLANDRVVLVPDRAQPDKFWAWPLPIGKAPTLSRCTDAALPLAAALFVVQASKPEVTPMREVQALLRIRQAVEVGIGSEFFEAERLAAVARVAHAVPSGVARVALSPTWRPELDAFLNSYPPRWPRTQTRGSVLRTDGASV